MFANPPLLARWAVVALVLYSMVMSAVLMQRASGSLAAVRPVIAIKQEAFDGYTSRLAHTSPRMEIGIFVAAALVTAILFLVLGSDLLLDDPVLVPKTPHKLPTDPLFAFVVLAAYTVVGWTFLRLMYITGRSARIRRSAIARTTADQRLRHQRPDSLRKPGTPDHAGSRGCDHRSVGWARYSKRDRWLADPGYRLDVHDACPAASSRRHPSADGRRQGSCPDGAQPTDRRSL